MYFADIHLWADYHMKILFFRSQFSLNVYSLRGIERKIGMEDLCSSKVDKVMLSKIYSNPREALAFC